MVGAWQYHLMRRCALLPLQATALLYRVAQRLGYFGNPGNWVPALSIKTISDFLDNALLGGTNALLKAETTYKVVLDPR